MIPVRLLERLVIAAETSATMLTRIAVALERETEPQFELVRPLADVGMWTAPDPSSPSPPCADQIDPIFAPYVVWASDHLKSTAPVEPPIPQTPPWRRWARDRRSQMSATKSSGANGRSARKPA